MRIESSRRDSNPVWQVVFIPARSAHFSNERISSQNLHVPTVLRLELPFRASPPGQRCQEIRWADHALVSDGCTVRAMVPHVVRSSTTAGRGMGAKMASPVASTP